MAPTAPKRREVRLAGRALAFGLLVAAAPAAAQTPGFGGAVAGGAGMRGTVDATDGGTTLDGIAPPTANLSTLGTPARPVRRRVNLPPLRNSAIPERYPVPLVKLKAYARAARQRAAGAEVPVVEVLPGPTVAALPLETRRTIRPEENPFGPIGYGVGSTRVFPYLEQSIGYDSNPEQISTGVKGSAYSRTEGGLAIQSDWLTHELKGTMRAGYNEFFSNPRGNRPDAVGVVDLRIDATRDTKIDSEFRFNVDTQRAGSPELSGAVRDRPLIATFGGTLGVTQNLGRFSVGLHGLADRTDYEDGELADGTPVRLAFQNTTAAGVKANIGYDLKPGLQPFVEVGYDKRIRDDTVDPFGYRRDSDGFGGRVGTSFEFWPQLTGTASAGYATRIYDDPRLKDLTGPTAAVTLAWAATPLTTVTVQGNTAFNETTVIGASGIESRAISVAVSHALFRYLTLTAALAFQNDDYSGVAITENTLTGTFKAEYHLSRSLVLTGTLSRQRLRSTVQGSDYTQNVALVGLRLQH